MYSNNRIAYWISDKKMQKINWKEFEIICMKYDFEIFKVSIIHICLCTCNCPFLFQLDLNKSLELQGPFNVFLHKLTDIIALENQGDAEVFPSINNLDKMSYSDFSEFTYNKSC